MKCTNCQNELIEGNSFCPVCGQKAIDDSSKSNSLPIGISERSVGMSIFLTLITFGIYGIYWQYLLVKNTRAITRNESSCVGEMICLLFVPFYSLYWWFTRGELMKNEFSKRDYNVSSSGAIFLVLSIFGLGIVASAIMQNDFNSLPATTYSNQRSTDMTLLKVRNLHTSFKTDAGTVNAVNGVSFNLERGKVLGIVGESGSGKSVTAYSIMQILAPTATISPESSIKLDGQELVGAGEKVMKTVRGNKVSIIFQDPMTSLNPTYTIGHQLMEAITLHTNRNREQAKERAVEMLRLVNVNEPEKRINQYPHELSGGMRQRVMIAMALACEPDILIADEPTTALDVTIQAQILELMKSLQQELNMAIIMITHDLGVVAQMCDEVIVMYAGSICEQGTADEIFYNPQHEYTKGLMRSIPTVENEKRKLQPISGTPIDLLNMPEGCPFAPRCDAAMKICIKQRAERVKINDDHRTACWMYIKQALEKGEIEIDEEGNSDE